MIILAITDSSRITDLLEQMSRNRNDLVVVNDIHRGTEALERMKPDIIILQNHLSGLSADILIKHLKSRLGEHSCRFLLISTPDAETIANIDGIINPAKPDADLKVDLEKLTSAEYANSKMQQSNSTSSRAEVLFQELSRDESIANAKTGGSTPLKNSNKTEPAADNKEKTGTFEREKTTNITDLRQNTAHRRNVVITDAAEPTPWYRHRLAGLLLITLLIVLAITIYQYKAGSGSNTAKPALAPSLTKQVDQAAKTEQQAAQKQVATIVTKEEAQTAKDKKELNRPQKLFSFIPIDASDKNYSKEYPGWERYLGEACEYRVYRGADKLIKSVQILDKSGAGIKDAFSKTILQEVAGTKNLQTVSSETKEGYIIQRSKAGELDIIQYRDEQDKQLQGMVIVWP